MLRMLESRLPRAIQLVGAVSVVALFLGGCVKEKNWKIGESAPAISVLDLQDKTVKLSDFKGKPVVLRFWATGCQACVAGMPKLDTMSKGYRKKGLVVLGINMGNSRPLVEAFAKGLKLTFPVLLDQTSITSQKYAVRAVPTTFFIDKNGIAKKVVVGEITEEVFDEAVGQLL